MIGGRASDSQTKSIQENRVFPSDIEFSPALPRIRGFGLLYALRLRRRRHRRRQLFAHNHLGNGLMRPDQRPNWPDKPVFSYGVGNQQLQFGRNLVRCIGYCLKLWAIHGACHRPGLRIGHCQSHFDSGLHKIRNSNYHCDAATDDHLCGGFLQPNNCNRGHNKPMYCNRSRDKQL